ncbi:MAG TPA: hypothetical protein VJI97_02085 [Candidatus Nanoarchaeia archaeon]|nr:hypothetical protein [Candidatus Nanoarchaeia archaeon]
MIVGFSFTKITAEKNESAKGKIDINNNVSIKDVVEDNLSLGKEKQTALKFSFEFVSKYEPNLGKIAIEGNLLYMTDAKKAKEILASWKKDKKVAQEIMAGLLNTVLTKCNIQALILSQDVNLPPPIPLPKVHMQQKQETKN